MKRNPIMACWGCTKATGWSATGFICPVYAEPLKTFAIRTAGVCPFNPPAVETVKQKQINALKASKRAAKGN